MIKKDFNIEPLNKELLINIQRKIDLKTKPPGALGKLEKLALQLALITGDLDNHHREININHPIMLVFAGDHGIAKEGVSIAPTEVTGQMVTNFLNGGAAINCFCRLNKMKLQVIDAGILNSIEHPDLVNQSLGRGTRNFVESLAMQVLDVHKGISLGANIVYQQINQGCNLFGFGEMGIANTSSASALMSAITKIALDDCVGRGTGISDSAYEKKFLLIQTALNKHSENFHNIYSTLAAVGGFEIIQIVGGMLAAAEKKCVILVDGFIASVAALVAYEINTNVIQYMIFCHQSEEKGHKKLLEYLKVETLLQLDLRLGEGTGAALALPLIKAAQSFYNEMASFEDVGINSI